MLTIAHLTDVHLPPIAGFTPRHWNVKRALGYANWVRSRRHVYAREVVDRLVADMRLQAPGHIAVTGDLVNIGLPREHINALAWLQSLGAPDQVSVVPGNHDIYCTLRSDPGSDRWAAYMASCEAGMRHAGDKAGFPYVRMLGRVALVGMNSAVPTPPFLATGRVGGAQLERVAGVLEQLGREGLFRLVLIHHPPLPGQAKPARALTDAAEMEAVLGRAGAELVIHGHNHRDMLAWCAVPGGGRVPVVGAPSASLARRHKAEPLARYNLYRIAGPPWAVEMIARGLAEPDGPIVEIARRTLSHAAAG